MIEFWSFAVPEWLFMAILRWFKLEEGYRWLITEN